MSSGSLAPSDAPSVAPSSSIAPSVGTLKSTPTRKKRTIVVVRKPRNRDLPDSGDDDDSVSRGGPASPKKKTLLVARRPRASEGRLFEDETPPHGRRLDGAPGRGRGGGGRGGTQRDGDSHHFSSSAAAKLEWLPDGHVLDKSVLGTAAAFEEMDAKLGWAPRPGEEEEEEGSQHSLRGTASSLRSSQSQKSKQSFRSLKSGGRQPTGDRSATGQGSRPGTCTSPDDRTDLQREMERYFRRITEAEDTAIRNRATSLRKEAKLMEHVGLTEKLTIRREGNSMRQWKRRQRDWQRVSEDVAARTGKVPEDLVMSTADEFRERSEEYQLIQCAIPTHEKFSSDGYWVMSLRGFGDRKCNVGNIFSGLTCSINDRTPPPRAVRKPTGRPADATRKRTWRNSEALAARKRQLAPTLKNLRPQRFEADETGGLLVQGQDLLEWAATSSRKYFELRHLQESEAMIAGLKALEDENRNRTVEGDPLFPAGGEGADMGGGSGRASARHAGPAVEVISPQTLLIESSAGSKTLKQATVTVRNTGSTVLFFSWSRVPRGETVVSVNGALVAAEGGGSGEGDSVQGNVLRERAPQTRSLPGRGLSTGRNMADAAARHAALQSPIDRFFCVQTTGTLLPGETAITSFSFKSVDPGVFSDRWRLETAPPAAFAFSTPPPPPDAAGASAATGQPTHDLDHPLLSTKLSTMPDGTSDGGGGGRGGGKETAKSVRNVVAQRRSNQDDGRDSRGGGAGLGEGHVLGGTAGGSAPAGGRGGGFGGVEVGLRGVALAPDTRRHARKRLADGVMRGILAAKVEEIVRDVVRGVRTPVREEEIRRRQRKDFLALNAEQGLYFTPRLYDGFMSLLQRAKATALNAEAGKYDIDNSQDLLGDPDRGSGVDDVGATPRQEEHMETESVGTEIPVVDVGHALAEAALGSGPSGKDPTPGGKGADGREDAGDRSDCSTRPVSARSSSGDEGKDDDDGNGREDQDEVVSDGSQQDGNDDAAVMAYSSAVANDPNAGQEAGEDAEDTGTGTERRESSAESGGSGGGGDGLPEETEESQARTSTLLLREMLERLDCREWDGAVNTVLDAIVGLTRWIPPPPPPLPPPTSAPSSSELGKGGQDPASRKASSGDTETGAGLAPTSTRSSSDAGDRSGDEGNSVDASDDGDEDEQDGEGDEEEDEEDEEEDEDKKEEDGDGESEDEAGQHPVFVEQKALRKQWRRLVLDAQLEPETDCTALMREAIESMVDDVAGAIEVVRREAAASSAAGGGGKAAAAAAAAAELQTPRGSVLGYDEESVANWAAACPPGPSMHDVEGGPQARAAAAAKAGNPKASFLALAYGEVSSRVAAAAEAFETNLSCVEGKRRSAAAFTRRNVVLEGPDGLLGGKKDAAVGDGDGRGSQVLRVPPPPPPLSRLAALKWEDIEGRRILLHVDLSRGVVEAEEGAESSDRGAGVVGIGIVDDSGSGGGGGSGPRQPFSEAVCLVAEQVREMLSAKPAAVAIVSEMAPASAVVTTITASTAENDWASSHTHPTSSMDPEATNSEQHPSPPTSGALRAVSAPPEPICCSLRPSAAAISSLLGMEVDFYDSVPDLAAVLERCVERGSGAGGSGDGDDGGNLSTFGMVPLMMVERLSLPGVVPAPPVEEPELSDGEEERLPDFSWGGEEAEAAAEQANEMEKARLAVEGPGEGDLGALLAGVVDIVVMDAPRALYEPRRNLPWGPPPTTGLTVAGSGLHGDLTAMAYLTECADKPLLAIVGGGSLEPRLKLIDGLLDLVDTLAVGGGLAATFIAAGIGMENAGSIAANDGSSIGGAAAATGAAEAEARRQAKKVRTSRWTGKGTAGQPRDPPDVVEAARRLLVKARKRGVEVILPSDFVVGDVEVDENGPLPGQVLADDDENEDANDAGDVGSANADGNASGGGEGGESTEEVVAPPDLEPEDRAMGFEYEGETMDASLEDGIPKGFRPMDVGPQTTAAFRDAVGRARAVLWHGMLGVAECSAFQFGTRDVLEAAVSAHDSDELREAGASPVVILCGRSLGEWAGRFAEVDDDVPPLGSGSGVSHICTDPVFCSRVLEGRIVPGLSQLSERDPPPADADLRKVLRRGPFGEEEGDEDDADDDGASDADSSSS